MKISSIWYIPAAQIKLVGKKIHKPYAAILQSVTGTVCTLTASEIVYDRGDAVGRIAQYGTASVGITAHGTPIVSGGNVHGESVDWVFCGLPNGVRIAGSSRIDYRGVGAQYVEVIMEGENAGVVRGAENVFIQTVKQLGLQEKPDIAKRQFLVGRKSH